MSGLALFISVFLACAVEAVEATTIVLAAGTARDWKSALLGTGAGLGTLVEIGDRDQILQHPKDPYTQRLLAAVPVPDPAEQRLRREARLAAKS